MADGKRRIGIVNSSTFGLYYPDLMERLERIGSIERVDVHSEIDGKELAAKLNGCDYLIASVNPHFGSAFFDGVQGLKLIARHGIGYDNVDVEAASRHGVAVTRVEGTHERDSVAELAIGLILSCMRKIVPAAQAVQDRRWDKRRGYTGMELSRVTVGIVGYGNIGSRTAEIIRKGFGSRVIAYDPNVDDERIRRDDIVPVGFEEVLRTSDVLSFHSSLNRGNYHFIGAEQLALMKDDVVIVNTARGELFNEQDLAAAARAGKIGAAGLDVVEKEPIKPDSPLLGIENIDIVPHIGGYGTHSLRKMDEKMVEDVESLEAGRIPDQLINPDAIRRAGEI